MPPQAQRGPDGRNSPQEQAIANALGVPTASVGLGPSAESFRPVDPENRDGPWRWQAVGPRGIEEGVADSYAAARKAAQAAPVRRRSYSESADMPSSTPLWKKYG